MKKSKWIKGLLLGAVGFVTLGVAACGEKGKQEENTFTGFTPGIATQIKRGELVFLDEFIDYVDGAYTITIMGGVLETPEDITDKKRWAAEFPGEYTITYTIHEGENAGTYTHTFIVPADTLAWGHRTEPITITYEKEFTFDWFYRELNLAITSYYPWEAFIDNIRIENEVREISADATTYFVDALQPHYITYGVRTQDGQEVRSIIMANVIYSVEQTDLYVNSLSTGDHVMDVAGVQSVKINGQETTDFTITADSVSISLQTLYNKYPGTNFVSMQTANGEVRDTLNVYTPHISFEDGYAVAPNFLTLHEGYKWTKNVGRTRIADKFVTDGNNALEYITTSYYWPQFLLHMEYLDLIFSDPEVNQFAFDVTYAGSKEEHTHRTFSLDGYGTGGLLYRNTPSTVKMTRAKYETLKADIAASIAAVEAGEKKTAMPNGWQMTLQNTRDAAGGFDNPAKMYFDNFRAIRSLGAETILSSDTSLGNIAINVEGVEKVTVNGATLPESAVQITANSVVIDIDWLKTNAGENIFTLKAGKKFYEKTINVFEKSYDFENMENADKAKFITWNMGLTKNAKSAIVDFNNSKALRMQTDGGYWAQVIINGDWLECLFKNPEISYVAFEMTLDNCGNAEVTSRSVNSNVMNNVVFMAGETKQIVITRKNFEKMRAESPNGNALITMDNQTTQPGGEVRTAWILDNFYTSTDPITYKSLYDFEDGQKVDFIWPSFKTDKEMSVVDYNGSKVLKMTSTEGTKDIAFEIDGDYMRYIFANENVTSLQLDMTVLFTISGTESTQVKLNYDGRAFGWSGNPNTHLFDSGVTKTLKISRAQFETWANHADGPFNTFRMVISNRTWALEWYLDNIRAITAEEDPNASEYVAAFNTQYGGASKWAGTDNNATYFAYEGINTVRTCLTANKAVGALVFKRGTEKWHLTQIFADESVTGFSFYMYNPNAFDLYVTFGKVSTYSSTNFNFAAEVGAATKIPTGVWTKVTLTREVYEANVENESGSSYNILCLTLFIEQAQSTISYFSMDSFQVEKA